MKLKNRYLRGWSGPGWYAPQQEDDTIVWCYAGSGESPEKLTGVWGTPDWQDSPLD